MQEVLIYIVFAGAIIFLGKRIYDQFMHKKKPGCADCGSEITAVKDLQKQQLKDK